jgi:hypothetical protein
MRAVRLAIAGLAALIAAEGQAGARSGGSPRSVDAVRSRAAGEPILAVVSLQKQRITVYDAKGWILRAPVSSGQSGRETPAGVFSVIQKDAEHYSNIYDDAYMPNMQRLTWSGIALHGGSLPGFPASHGCIRMPYDFAARLFEATQLGLRVIVAPSDPVPIEITHPLLLRPKPDADAMAAARVAEADEAGRKAGQARLAAGTAYREEIQAMVPVRRAENLKLRAEAELQSAETAFGTATSDEAKAQAEDAKAKAAARVSELQQQWSAAKQELQPKLDALMAARQAALAAEDAQFAAADVARQASRALEPVSVLISRKTQRLYVRQAFEPIFDSPITIQDPDRPIGTHVFTAMERVGGEHDVRWSVVTLENGGARGDVDPRNRSAGGRDRDAGPMPAQPDSARAALDRIVIPQDVLDRIPGITPRSSLIVTDGAPSSETSKGTDFVVLLSDQPQGGIKFRRRAPADELGYARPRARPPYWGSPVTGPFSTW